VSDALLTPMAVATGVVVIVVVVAVVLVVLLVTVSMRGRQKRAAQRRGETRYDLAAAHERANAQSETATSLKIRLSSESIQIHSDTIHSRCTSPSEYLAREPIVTDCVASPRRSR
jgi:hypothetical protein